MNQLTNLPNTANGYVSPLQPLDEALNRIFSNTQEETRLLKARRIMGDVVAETSDEDLEIFLTEFQYLIDSWLDEFERLSYGGQTLKEMLQE